MSIVVLPTAISKAAISMLRHSSHASLLARLSMCGSEADLLSNPMNSILEKPKRIE
jgi:hypothetical protein